MKLYIPEIGDQLKLTKDWSFKLHGEHRNETLGQLKNHYLVSYGWVDETVVPKMRPIDYHIDYPPRPEYHRNDFFSRNVKLHDEYNKACKEAEQSNPEYIQYQKDSEEWSIKATQNTKEYIEVTIPKGTILKVDRIYIRKGVSDYSSITFCTNSLGCVVVRDRWIGSDKTRKVKSIRFWAKLIDCNEIEFEKV